MGLTSSIADILSNFEQKIVPHSYLLLNLSLRLYFQLVGLSFFQNKKLPNRIIEILLTLFQKFVIVGDPRSSEGDIIQNLQSLVEDYLLLQYNLKTLLKT